MNVVTGKTNWLWVAAVVVLAFGCATESPPAARLEPQDFQSDLPSGEGRTTAPANAAASSPGAASTTPASSAIAEADVIAIDGDRLFAFAERTGLSIIDISDPTRLQRLGEYRELRGAPYAVHVFGAHVLVLQPGEILVLDVANPAAPKLVAQQGVTTGRYSAWRVVGDVLYVVTDLKGSCPGCTGPTVVSSFSLGELSMLERVDELSLTDPQAVGGSNDISLIGDQRVYLAGRHYAADGSLSSAIRIVDISDRSGKLRSGATWSVRGQISNASQLDEQQGVLRVLSEPSSTGKPANAETFRIQSSDAVTPLGELSLALPDRGEIRTARFIGDHVFFVSDALYRLDLADPAQPKLASKLALPSRIVRIEAHADRLIGIGTGDDGIGIALSLFDTHDAAQTKPLSRVTLPTQSELGGLTPAQMQVSADAGLILVPHGNWDSGAGSCFVALEVTVRLIDWTGDSLVPRGAVQLSAEPRRTFLHRDHVLAVGDTRVDSFAIADRSAPVQRSSLVLASEVSRAIQLDGAVVRITEPSWFVRPAIEIVPEAGATDPNQTASAMSLRELVTTDPAERCRLDVHIQDVHAHGSRLYVLYEAYYDSDTPSVTSRHGVAVIDAADPSAPRVFRGIEWPMDRWVTYEDYHSDHSTREQLPNQWRDATLVTIEEGYTDSEAKLRRLRVLDLSDPTDPAMQTLPLAEDPYVGLTIGGNTVFASRYQELSPNRIQYLVDRIDIRDPAAPRALPAIHTPGALWHFDPASQRAITHAFRRETIPGERDGKCYRHFDGLVDAAASGCTGYTSILQLTELRDGVAWLEDSLPVPDGLLVHSSAASAGQVFLTLMRTYYDSNARDCSSGFCVPTVESLPTVPRLLVLGGLRSGKLQSAQLELGFEDDSEWSSQAPLVVVNGKRALLYGNYEYFVVDATDQPSIVRSEHVGISAVHLVGDRALLALGYRGVQWLDM
ncbi:MAG TPA: beta-propeller domain-containing protein [Polyangiales bacterium]|nr:beta-propeller domain-containing protein [Polyangiales bacterium]